MKTSGGNQKVCNILKMENLHSKFDSKSDVISFAIVVAYNVAKGWRNSRMSQ